MRKSWLLCVLLGTLAWGQAAPGTPPPAQPAQGSTEAAAAVPDGAAVITVEGEGVCPAQPKPAATAATKGTAAKPGARATATREKSTEAKSPAAGCKVVITKAEFERLASGVAPNMTPQLKKQLASVLPRLIAMSEAAKKKGLDKTSRYEETLKFAKMQILTNELQRSIQDEAGKVPPEDIATYYKEHPESFEQYNLDRLFVPRTKQEDNEAKEKEEESKDEKLSEEQQKEKQAEEKSKADEAEQAMAKLAQSLRERAAAGEDFVKLQKEAFDASGMKIESPTVNLPKVRRNGLPPAHAAVFELKAGDVSQVINDSGGHYIYRVKSKDVPTLDQVKDEILNTLKNQRTRDMMDKLNASFKPVQNEAYFGPGGPGVVPPPRAQNPRMAPSPMAPAAPSQAPPPAQAPAPKPN